MWIFIKFLFMCILLFHFILFSSCAFLLPFYHTLFVSVFLTVLLFFHFNLVEIVLFILYLVAAVHNRLSVEKKGRYGEAVSPPVH